MSKQTNHGLEIVVLRAVKVEQAHAAQLLQDDVDAGEQLDPLLLHVVDQERRQVRQRVVALLGVLQELLQTGNL